MENLKRWLFMVYNKVYFFGPPWIDDITNYAGFAENSVSNIDVYSRSAVRSTGLNFSKEYFGAPTIIWQIWLFYKKKNLKKKDMAILSCGRSNMYEFQEIDKFCHWSWKTIMIISQSIDIFVLYYGVTCVNWFPHLHHGNHFYSERH